MGGSSFKKACEFKSPSRVVVKFLQQSRDSGVCKYRKVKEDFQRTLVEQDRLQKKYEALVVEAGELRARLRNLECERYRQAREASITLPVDPPIGPHGFGAKMVLLAVALVKVVGFRAAEKVLRIVFEWLGVKQRVPHFTTIRNWFQRLGVAALQQPLEKADDWVWMTDHSNQIGQEKILVGLAIRASNLPPPGTAIQFEQLRVLTVQPGKSWKREDVATVYSELAAQCGVPRAVLCDGAVELRESAECLKTLRGDCITLHDFKHKAANYLEAIVGKSERFVEFLAKVGNTRCSIQQTEMAHLTPPPLKAKARFMNIGPLVDWSTIISWLLKNPEAKSRQWMTTDRLESKLGWLRSFEPELAIWDECQQVINRGLELINTQGLFIGVSDQLRLALGVELKHAMSQELAKRLIQFVQDAESQIEAGERLPLSTEILESSFALYKQLEGQHSKGGFTSLVATFAALLTTPTVATIKASFAKVSTKDVKAWVATHLGVTVTSKRRTTYQEMKQATGRCRKANSERAKKTTTTG